MKQLANALNKINSNPKNEGQLAAGLKAAGLNMKGGRNPSAPNHPNVGKLSTTELMTDEDGKQYRLTHVSMDMHGDTQTAIHARAVWEVIKSLDGCTPPEIKMLLDDLDPGDISRAVSNLHTAVNACATATQRGTKLVDIRPISPDAELPDYLYFTRRNYKLRGANRVTQKLNAEDLIGRIEALTDPLALLQVSIAAKRRREEIQDPKFKDNK